MLNDLQCRGDFQHNMKVLKTGGELAVLRRPATSNIVNVKDYKPCPYCTVFVTIAELWSHTKTCEKNVHQEHNSNVAKKADLLCFPNQNVAGATTELQEMVLGNMKKDEITKVVLSDELITTFGSFLLCSQGLRKANLISQRMRILARLLIQLKVVTSEENDLKGFILPRFFDVVVRATKLLGGYSLSTLEGEAISIFHIPALPLKIGYALDRCVQVCKGMGIKKGDTKLVENAERFAPLYNLEWGIKISSVALRTQATNKFNGYLIFI